MKDKLYIIAIVLAFGFMAYNNIEEFANLNLEKRDPFRETANHLITKTRSSAQYPEGVPKRISGGNNYGSIIRGTTKLVPDSGDMESNKMKIKKNIVPLRQIFTSRQSRLRSLAGNSLRGDLEFSAPKHDWFNPSINLKADRHKGFDFESNYLKHNHGRDVSYHTNF